MTNPDNERKKLLDYIESKKGSNRMAKSWMFDAPYMKELYDDLRSIEGLDAASELDDMVMNEIGIFLKKGIAISEDQIKKLDKIFNDLLLKA